MSMTDIDHETPNGKETIKSPDGRPVIKIDAGNLPAAVDAAEDLLIAAGGVYHRNGVLVRIGQLILPKRPPLLLPIPISLVALVEILTKLAWWMKPDGRSKSGYAISDCPPHVAATLLARNGCWRLPVLHAVVTAPTLRSDGSILDQPGYDPQTHIYYDPQAVEYQPIPENPTKEEARRALDVLCDLVCEVPFTTHEKHGHVSRSVFLSAFLTGLIRASMPKAPAHGFDATGAGSGKSMLTDAIGYAVTGESVPAVAQGRDDAETEKRMATALMYGDPIINLDNCTQPIEGDLLCQMVTAPIVSLRILGRSERVLAPNIALLIVNGNSLTIAGDMVRRAMRGTIDPGVECPEDRVFKTVRPDRRVKADRATYVAAGLTVLRAFEVVGRPQQSKHNADFEEWTQRVRDALIWLGEPDPWLSTEQTRADDPARQKVVNVMDRWLEAFGDKPVRVNDLVEMALKTCGDSIVTGQAVPRFINEPLRDALLAVAADGNRIDKQSLSLWLRSHKDRVVAGCKIVKAGALHGYPRWQVVQVD